MPHTVAISFAVTFGLLLIIFRIVSVVSAGVSVVIKGVFVVVSVVIVEVSVEGNAILSNVYCKNSRTCGCFLQCYIS